MKNPSKTDQFVSFGAIFAALVILVAILAGNALTANAQVTPPPTAQGATLEQRVAQRKAERAIVLTEKDSKRVADRCLAAQAKFRAMQQKTIQVLDNRTKTYQKIDGRIWLAIGKLKVANKDTFSLENQRQVYAGKISTFKTTGDAYKQTIDDIAVINCKADTVAFKALLETARLYSKQLRSQGTDISNYVINDIKPAYSQVASDLQGKTSTQEEE